MTREAQLVSRDGQAEAGPAGPSSLDPVLDRATMTAAATRINSGLTPRKYPARPAAATTASASCLTAVLANPTTAFAMIATTTGLMPNSTPAPTSVAP